MWLGMVPPAQVTTLLPCTPQPCTRHRQKQLPVQAPASGQKHTAHTQQKPEAIFDRAQDMYQEKCSKKQIVSPNNSDILIWELKNRYLKEGCPDGTGHLCSVREGRMVCTQEHTYTSLLNSTLCIFDYKIVKIESSWLVFQMNSEAILAIQASGILLCLIQVPTGSRWESTTRTGVHTKAGSWALWNMM